MLDAVRAVVKNGKVHILENINMSEEANFLVTILSTEEAQFWLNASEESLHSVWDNEEDNIYEELLQK